MRTYNFLLDKPSGSQSSETAIKGEFMDTRNGIICVDPTPDLDCYINYIQLLNSQRNKWKSYGYLDLGMMPIVMGPSFLHQVLLKALVPVIDMYEIPCHNMPPVSLMYMACKLPDYDIWAFKDIVSEKTGIPIDKLTLEGLIRWCLKI